MEMTVTGERSWRNPPGALLEAALDYAKRGWRVFPVYEIREDGCACGRPCRDAGKHPRIKGWPALATAVPQKLVEWWSKWPDANVGIATGSRSGIVLVDIDPRSGGERTLAEYERHHGPLPSTAETVTGGGGRHLLFRPPGQKRVRNSAGKLGGGLDIRGDGGYFVAPPSRHASGRFYEWAPSLHPDALQFATMPAWLVGLLGAAGPSEVALAGAGGGGTRARARSLRMADGTGRPIPAGERNSTLTRRAGVMRRGGFDEAAISAAIHDQNERLCSPPLLREEVDKIVRSASRWLPPWLSDRLSFIDDPRLDPLSRLILLVLVEHVGHDGWSRPGIRGIARRCSISPSTVVRRLVKLEQAGRIGIDHRAYGNRYFIRPFAPNLLTQQHPDKSGSSVSPVGTLPHGRVEDAA
jgi:hypothetical protein